MRLDYVMLGFQDESRVGSVSSHVEYGVVMFQLQHFAQNAALHVGVHVVLAKSEVIDGRELLKSF